MRRTSPEPERVFSPHQWAEIAKAISLDKISSKEKREICDAIFAYEFARIEIEQAADKAEEEENRPAEKLTLGRKAVQHLAISSGMFAD